ncbi:MAG: hypothetical protein NC034_00140 [Ruminococcus sp.]|nr:hypothetical protein [Ruminococcus sp.]
MGLIFVMFSIFGLFALFISTTLFGTFIYGIRKKSVKTGIIGGISYIISMVITIVCFLLPTGAADYGGFSKNYLIFVSIVAFGMHLTALGTALKIKWLSIPGVLAAVLPFVYLFILILKIRT